MLTKILCIYRANTIKKFSILRFSNISETFLKQNLKIRFVKYLQKNKKEIIDMSKIQETNEKIADRVVEGYKKIESGVVSGYKKVERGFVSGFEKVSDKCIDTLFAKPGESVEDAKKRLSGNAEKDIKKTNN